MNKKKRFTVSEEELMGPITIFHQKMKELQDEISERDRQIGVYKQEVIMARKLGYEEGKSDIQRIKAQILDRLFGL